MTHSLTLDYPTEALAMLKTQFVWFSFDFCLFFVWSLATELLIQWNLMVSYTTESNDNVCVAPPNSKAVGGGPAALPSPNIRKKHSIAAGKVPVLTIKNTPGANALKRPFLWLCEAEDYVSMTCQMTCCERIINFF